MSTYPKSPKEMTAGLFYFPRMLDKIRLHARGELAEDYHKNLGAVKAGDGVLCNFLRVHYRDLRERTLAGGSNEEILEWCFEKGRRLNSGDIFVWNGFISKLGWNDVVTPLLEETKQKAGFADRADISTVFELIDLDEGRRSGNRGDGSPFVDRAGLLYRVARPNNNRAAWRAGEATGKKRSGVAQVDWPAG